MKHAAPLCDEDRIGPLEAAALARVSVESLKAAVNGGALPSSDGFNKGELRFWRHDVERWARSRRLIA